MAEYRSENTRSAHPLGLTPQLRLAKVEALVLRVPIDTPVQTSFGVLQRPDGGGGARRGPPTASEGCGRDLVQLSLRRRRAPRARAGTSVAPILASRWDSPCRPSRLLSRRLHVLGIQSGEPGTIAQAIAGADIALWDLAARRAGQPLWQLLGRDDASPRVPAYASGLSPTLPEELAAAMRAEGFRAFKLKVGFGVERDVADLAACARCSARRRR